MLKSILNLKGAQQLSKTEQKDINGGGPGTLIPCCNPELHCCTLPGLPQLCWSGYGTGPGSSCQFWYSNGGPGGTCCI